MFKRNEHAPAHLLRDNSPYFITGAIYQKCRILTDNLKKRLLETIQESLQKYSWTLQHWVILDNHYHFMAMSNKGADLSKIMKKVHGISGRYIVAEIHCESPVWWNYWDYCPRNDKDYYTRLNYLFYNPMRHGYVTDLKDYEFSSFPALFQEEGREVLTSQFKKYPEYKTLSLSEGFDDE